MSAAQRRRRQFLARRLLGVGVLLAVLIAVVLGFKGFLDARSDRGLRHYATNVGTIMRESEQRGEDFFALLDSPAGTSPIDLRNRILASRDASAALLARAEKVGEPGELRNAQEAIILALTLRRNALEVVAENVSQATAEAETGDAIERITELMGSLYASDIIWSRIAAPEITRFLGDEGIDAPELPPGSFMPADATKFLEQATLVQMLNSITGRSTTAGTHGSALLSTSIGNTTLAADASSEVPRNAREIRVEVQNQGESDETGITVTVSIDGEAVTGTIQALGAGETETVKIPLIDTPPSGMEVTVEVVVEPVPGEQLTDNNAATYTVVFG